MDIHSLGLLCEASYCPDFISTDEAQALFDELASSYDLSNKTIQMADGSQYEAENRLYLFADEHLTSYDKLTQVWGRRSVWPDSLRNVRDKIASIYGVCFPVARSVFYQDGFESMGFHSDPPAYGATDAIASLSLGAERDFILRPIAKKDENTVVRLASGSLLFMGDKCQDLYEHGLPVNKDCAEPRINITFRKFGWD